MLKLHFSSVEGASHFLVVSIAIVQISQTRLPLVAMLLWVLDQFHTQARKNRSPHRRERSPSSNDEIDMF